MTDNSKPRLALDLDDIERQLKMAQAGPAPKADPLAELARIVGQDDPFGQMLASGPKGARPTRAEPALDDVFEQREAAPQAPAHAAPQGYAPPQGYAAPQGYADPRALQARYEDDYPPRAGDFGRMVDEAAAYDYQPSGPDYGDDFQPLAQPRRSRKGLMLAGAALGAVVIAAGGVMAWKGGAATSDGKPPVIQADASPLKVQPQNPGGLDIPNQNKQIYERGGPDGQTKMVNREEQPVDVRQAARVIAPADAAPQPSTTASAGGLVAPSPTAGLGEPRKVRTVSIRPEPAPTSSAPMAAQPAPVQTPIQAQAPKPAPAAPAQAAPTIASLAGIPDPRTTSTTPQARPPAQPVASPMPAPAPAPAASKAPQRVAALGDVPAAAPVPAEPAAGGFAVQLSVGSSDEDARAVFRKLQQKHNAELGSRQPLIVKADANGRTIYRVRVAAATREDAQALCSRLSASGQQCFVAKN
jgi:hypothetical protein